MTLTETGIEIVEKTRKTSQRVLMLYNDDVNTFDFVISTLQELCGHSAEQAEQCAMIVHNNGKCDIKRGSVKQLKPLFEALCDRSLTAAIEK